MLKLIKYFTLIIFIGFLVGVFLYWQGVSRPFKEGGEEIVLIIEPGEGVERIGKKLEQAKIIRSGFYFKAYVWQAKAGSKLQAGEYLLGSGMSIKEIVNSFVKGKSLGRERTIKIIEGWTINEIAEYLSEQGLAGAEFKRLAKSNISAWPFSFARLGLFGQTPARVDFEGYFFPDTYRIFKDAGEEDIIKKMFDNLDSKLSSGLREEIVKQNKTIHDIITAASIIEREVSRDSDRALVAGILYKRLEIGMRLEMDSTINYITGKNNPRSTLKDLEIDSPYNTYKYYGLPPGPISNPGLASIKAAIYPEASEYLFYLNRPDTGETIFSKTHEEHVRNKNKYFR